MNISVDKAGDLKIGRKKCRLYKKDEVVKVAKKYGINTEKKTVQQLCGSIKAKANNSMNNVPLAKLYPQAAKKRAAARKKVSPSRKAAIDKKIVTSFMKNMVTTNANVKKLRELNEKSPKPKPKPKPKPRAPNPAAVARARANIKNMVNKRVSYMNSDTMKKINRAPPRAVMRIARELRRLR
jgi:hypothetical protein